MSYHSRAIFLFLTIVAVVLVSAVGTTSVYADDGTPPPPATEEAVDPSTGGEPVVTSEPAEAAPTEAPVVTDPAEAVPTEAPVVTEPTEGVPTEAPVVTEPTEAAPEEAPVVEEPPAAEPETEAATILEQVPEDTTVTVLNTEGEAQPLTTQESADTILTGDPIWCPAAQSTPTPGANGCTPSFPDFSALLAYLSGNATYQGDGTIYVTPGAYTGPETSIDFNSPTYDLSYIHNSNLTIQGGWGSMDPIDASQFNIPIAIGTGTNPWVGSLVFNNISISQVANQTGLTLYTEGDITLTNVSVTESLAGADLNAGGVVTVDYSQFNGNKKFGANINAGGAVYSTGSNFDDNAVEKDAYDGHGLQINTQDEVLLDTVSASNNEEYGANIIAVGPVVVLNSVFSGNISYTHNCNKGHYCYDCKETKNGGYGLKIVTTDGAYLYGVTASDNYLYGAHIEAAEVEISDRDRVHVYGNNYFSNNGSGSASNPQGYGLEVISTGAVTLRAVEANDNQLFGANIKAEGDVNVLNSFFDGNKSYYKSCTTKSTQSCYEQVCTKNYLGYGIQVVTNGNIALEQVSAQENNLFGAHLEGAMTTVIDSIFNHNGSGDVENLTGRGLEVKSTGEVSLINIQASYNELFGANIQTTNSVSVVSSFFNGHKVYTYSCTQKSIKSCHEEVCVQTLVGGGYGIEIIAGKSVAIADVEASDNYLFGMHVVGAGVAIDEGNFDNNQEGIKIENVGGAEVELARVSANGNLLSGATILSDGNVSVNTSTFNGNKSYTYSYCKGKTYYGYGIKVVTTGDITLSEVTADGNYLFGASLTGAGIDVGDGSFSNNGTGKPSDHVGSGLEIVSTGSGSLISVADVVASNNQLFGANIKADGLVLVSSSVFNGNQSYTSTCYCKTYDGYGLQVVTASDLLVDNVTANENYLFGASLTGANVWVTNSVFSFNASPLQQGKAPTGRGLEVKSTGDTLVQGVDASNNQLFGASIEAGGQVNVLSSTFTNNKYYTYTSCHSSKSAGVGLKVVTTDPTLGSITLNDVDALDNGAEGAILNGASTVTVSGGSSFNNNGASGLSITASGNVTLNDVTANGNKVDGVDVTGVCTNVVTVNGGTFEDNGKYGIKIINATYNQLGSPMFANNPSGNVFQDSSTCFSSASTLNSASTTESNSGYSGSQGDGHSYHHHHHHHR